MTYGSSLDPGSLGWQKYSVDDRIKKLVKFDFETKSENHLKAKLRVDPKLPSLEGHFPGRPILPAVSIIDISLFMLSSVAQNVEWDKIEVKRSKFMAMVAPNQEVEIEANCDDGSNWKVVWRSPDDQVKLAQVHLVL